MSLAVLAQHPAVVLDDDRGVVVDAGLGFLVEGHDQHHLVLFGELLHATDGGPVVRLRGRVPFRVLLGAEVGTEEDLLQAGDLGPLGGRLGDQLLMPFDRLFFGHVGVGLDQRRSNSRHLFLLSS